MKTNTNYWLVDANAIARMKRVNTSDWNVLEVIEDRFFVVKGAAVLYQVHKAGYSGAGIEALGANDIEAVQHINSIFNTGSWYWMVK